MTSDRTDGREPLEILQPLTGLEGRGAPVLGLAFGPGGRLLVAGDLAGNVLFWDMARARDPEADRRPIPVAYSEKAHVGPVNDVVSHPTRPIVASCGDDKQVVLWDVSDPARIRPLPEPLRHSGFVQTAAFCPARNLLATAAWDGRFTSGTSRTRTVRSMPGSCGATPAGSLRSTSAPTASSSPRAGWTPPCSSGTSDSASTGGH